MTNLTRKTLEGRQPINMGRLLMKEGFLNPERRNKEESSFSSRLKTRTTKERVPAERGRGAEKSNNPGEELERTAGGDME
ncbi:hypothetical protein NDU88_002949 [Pleurodeles waltl]|uniref:Uncharacterized protein n=1 Tax=Pleurodeles waltl TaxID=8319 RepID=A0AAV7MSV7_PLEWA|nr:hypothetical protein NDU88_002949 [Pleurodeles waltl]